MQKSLPNMPHNLVKTSAYIRSSVHDGFPGRSNGFDRWFWVLFFGFHNNAADMQFFLMSGVAMPLCCPRSLHIASNSAILGTRWVLQLHWGFRFGRQFGWQPSVGSSSVETPPKSIYNWNTVGSDTWSVV